MFSPRPARAYAVCLVLAVPALAGTAVLWGGSPTRSAVAFDAATAWLSSPEGFVVKANGLVHGSSGQIIESVPVPLTSSGARLLPLPNKLVAAQVDGGRSTTVDTVDHTVGTIAETGTNTLVSDGTRLYRISSDTVEVVDPDGLSPGTSYPTGRIAHWAATTGALYIGDDTGSLQRIDQDGMSTVDADAPGHAISLTAIDGGAAAWDAASGTVTVIEGTRTRKTIHRNELRSTDAAATFGADPDGSTFAVRDANTVTVLRGNDIYNRDLPAASAADLAPVLAEDRLYLPEPAHRTVLVLTVTPGLPNAASLEFTARGSTGDAYFDTHRTGSFLWFDDVRGPVAYAIHQSQATKIVKYAIRARPPTTPPPTTRKTPTSPHVTHTTRPPTTAPHPTPPARHRTPSKPSTHPTTKSPTPRHSSRSPSPSPSADDCHGEDTTLSVRNQNHTGPHPSIYVEVCVKAPAGTEYWIVSHTDGPQWFAKTPISGRQSARYSLELLNDAGTGGSRDFVVVAARSPSAQQWLSRNRAADESGADFDRTDLAPGIREISARVHSQS